MLYTETAARDNIRNRDGKRVFYLGKQDQLTPGARDLLRRERVQILPAEEAKAEKYQLLGGGFVTEKPEHMTHLNGQILVRKTHPRIRFRGEMDLLEAELMLCQLECPSFHDELEQILELSRQLIRCDVLEEPVADAPLCGLNQQQLRSHSHFPQEYYGQPHFMPSADDGRELLQLNRCRCMARKAELSAVEAFSDREGNPIRTDILRALNRMSSMLYILMIRRKREL